MKDKGFDMENQICPRTHRLVDQSAILSLPLLQFLVRFLSLPGRWTPIPPKDRRRPAGEGGKRAGGVPILRALPVTLEPGSQDDGTAFMGSEDSTDFE